MSKTWNIGLVVGVLHTCKLAPPVQICESDWKGQNLILPPKLLIEGDNCGLQFSPCRKKWPSDCLNTGCCPFTLRALGSSGEYAQQEDRTTETCSCPRFVGRHPTSPLLNWNTKLNIDISMAFKSIFESILKTTIPPKWTQYPCVDSYWMRNSTFVQGTTQAIRHRCAWTCTWNQS